MCTSVRGYDPSLRIIHWPPKIMWGNLRVFFWFKWIKFPSLQLFLLLHLLFFNLTNSLVISRLKSKSIFTYFLKPFDSVHSQLLMCWVFPGVFMWFCAANMNNKTTIFINFIKYSEKTFKDLVSVEGQSCWHVHHLWLSTLIFQEQKCWAASWQVRKYY